MYEEVWKELERDPAPGKLIVQRRVRPDLHHDIFLQHERPLGTRSVDMKLYGPVGSLWRDMKDFRGLKVHVVLESQESARVRLSEKDQRYRDVFVALTGDIISSLPSDQRRSALDFVSGRLRRWQACLETSPEGLSDDKQLGLFAELTALIEVFAPAVGAERAVPSWRGPVAAYQDFQYGRVAVEVKACRGPQPGRVVISSARQLDATACDALYLLVVLVDARQDGTGSSLPEVVSRARALAKCSAAAAMDLDDLLLEALYLDVHAPKYTIRFTVRALNAYSVTSDFPRLVEAGLPPGIDVVKYRLDLDACSPWRIDPRLVGAALERETKQDGHGNP